MGKTSVAKEMHRQLAEDGVTHCLIEGDNLDLAFPVPWQQGLRLAEVNLAGMWANYKATGYSRLIFTNTACVRADVLPDLLRSLGDDPVVNAVLLTATDEVAESRLAQREIGGGLDRHVDRSRHAARELEEAAPRWVWRIHTDNRCVAHVAHEIISRLRWSATRD